MIWGILAFAICIEVATTLALKVAVERSRALMYLIVVAGYVVAFSCLAWTLRMGLPIGIAYGIWAASGVAMTAVLARVVLGEPLTKTMLCGIAIITAGVLLIETGH